MTSSRYHDLESHHSPPSHDGRRRGYEFKPTSIVLSLILVSALVLAWQRAPSLTVVDGVVYGALNVSEVEVRPGLAKWGEGDDEYVGMCVSVKGQRDDIPEWLRHYYYHHNIRSFYFFDDGTVPPLSDQLTSLELGIPRSSITFHYITPTLRHSTHQQLSAYESCVRLWGHRHTWLALFDIDEFLELPDSSPTERKPDGLSLKGFLREFERDAGAVGVNWRLHTSRGWHWGAGRTRRGETRKSFARCLRDPEEGSTVNEDNAHVKLIVQPQYFQSMLSPHHALLTLPTVGEQHDLIPPLPSPSIPLPAPPYHRRPITRDRIVLHHYVNKSWEEFKEKMERGNGMDDPKGVEFWERIEGAKSVECKELVGYVP